jgi:hypothetical protein
MTARLASATEQAADTGRVSLRDVCERLEQVAGIRTGGLVGNALATQALDEPHLFETLGSELTRSESNCPTHDGRGTWDALE